MASLIRAFRREVADERRSDHRQTEPLPNAVFKPQLVYRIADYRHFGSYGAGVLFLDALFANSDEFPR
ncbi:hypothetical protein FQZ97_1174290 [compost metagenome]